MHYNGKQGVISGSPHIIFPGAAITVCQYVQYFNNGPAGGECVHTLQITTLVHTCLKAVMRNLLKNGFLANASERRHKLLKKLLEVTESGSPKAPR